jgi:hypothetical protein
LYGRSSPTDEQYRWLNKIKTDLEQQYLGFNRIDDVVGRTSTADLIDQGDIDRALADPLLANTEVGKALAEYWVWHEHAMEASEIYEFGSTAGSWRTVADAAYIRNDLRQRGAALAEQYPEFAPMWNDFLIREFKDLADEDPEVMEALGG